MAPALDALARGRLCRRLRRDAADGQGAWVGRLPDRVRSRLELDGPAVRPLRVEIGGGPYPLPGYVHVDADPRARHLEYLAPAWDLPFASGGAVELVAVHVLEHVHPGLVERTLREWIRVLSPGGVAQIHVPNASSVLSAYLEGDLATKWAAMSAVFGMPCDPKIIDPSSVMGEGERPEHRALYDLELLTSVLVQAGFGDVVDVSDEVVDRHTEGWDQMYGIAKLSLVVRASVAGASAA